MGGTRKQAGPMDRTLCGRRSTRCRECSAPSLLFMGRTRIRCPCHDDERKVWNRYNANRSGIVPEGLNILGRMYSSAAFAPVFALLVLNFSGSCVNDSCASILKGCPATRQSESDFTRDCRPACLAASACDADRAVVLGFSTARALRSNVFRRETRNPFFRFTLEPGPGFSRQRGVYIRPPFARR